MKLNPRSVFAVMYSLFLIVRAHTAYPTYSEYCGRYQKYYPYDEYILRKQVYEEKLVKFESIVAYVPGVNKFTDWFPE